MKPFAESDQPQRLIGGHRTLGDFGHQLDVLQRAQTRNQVVELKNEPDVFAPESRQLAFIRLEQVVVTEAHFDARVDVQPTKNVQQRRFAAARWPQQDDEFALVKFKVNRTQRVNGDFAHSINLRQSTSAEDGFMWSRNHYRRRPYW